MSTTEWVASNSQFTEMFLEWPLSKMLLKSWSIHEQGSGEWGLYEHKQNHKKSSLKLLVRFWNNLIEMFLEWPFSELFLKFWSVNKHGISEWRLLALYRHKEIHVNSSLQMTKKMARAISKNHVSDPGPSWPSCFLEVVYAISRVVSMSWNMTGCHRLSNLIFSHVEHVLLSIGECNTILSAYTLYRHLE